MGMEEGANQYGYASIGCAGSTETSQVIRWFFSADSAWAYAPECGRPWPQRGFLPGTWIGPDGGSVQPGPVFIMGWLPPPSWDKCVGGPQCQPVGAGRMPAGIFSNTTSRA